MEVTKNGDPSCSHKWTYIDFVNTQICLICGRCETPNC